jgi:bacteriocin-like protein
MNTYEENALIQELSNAELEAVSGGDGERHQVTKEQYELLLAIRMAVRNHA